MRLARGRPTAPVWRNELGGLTFRLGDGGVADRWADLAVAAWSTEWNYGPGYDGLVYSGYGVAPDAERIAYYRRLWDAG